MSDRRINALILATLVLGLLWTYLSPRQAPVAKTPPLPVVVPGIALNGQNRTIYFCWVGDAAGAGVWITKGSGVPGLVTGDGR